MREKLVDSILLAALVVVCIVILYTLFSPATVPWRRAGAASTQPQTQPPTTRIADPETDETDAAGAPGTDIIPVIPTQGGSEGTEAPAAGEETPPDAGETFTEPSVADRTDEAALEDGAEDAAAREDDAATEDDALADPLPPLPEGAFALERIGFSFAGGVGACNVVLEPWRHAAVSPDILDVYPCGSEITVSLDESVAGRERVALTVADTMPASKTRTVNIYIAPDEPAFEYGVKEGSLEP